MDAPDDIENPYIEPPFVNDELEWDSLESMSSDEMKQQAEQLREAVEHHSRLYYVEFDPIISDSAYDTLFHRLEDLEDELGIDDPDSPTNTVGTDRAPTESE